MRSKAFDFFLNGKVFSFEGLDVHIGERCLVKEDLLDGTVELETFSSKQTYDDLPEWRRSFSLDAFDNREVVAQEVYLGGSAKALKTLAALIVEFVDSGDDHCHILDLDEGVNPEVGFLLYLDEKNRQGEEPAGEE